MKRKGIFLRLVLIVLTICLAPSFVQEVANKEIEEETLKEARRPQWKTGDSWTFSCKGGRSHRRRVVSFEVLGKEKFKDTPCYVLKTGDVLKEYYTYDFNPRARLAGDTVLLEVIPELQRFNWPLKVGKKWESTHVFKEMFSYSTKHAEFEVKGVEKIRVPAGRFVTFKIVQKDPSRVRNPIWQEWWYSPEVKWFVKKKAYWRRFRTEEWKLSKYKV